MPRAAPPVPPSQQPGVQIAQIFVEKVSFSHRGDPYALPANTPPLVGDLQVQIETGLNANKTAGVTRITVSTDPSKEPIYNVALTVSGLFERQAEANDTAMPIEVFLRDHSVPLLYPFVREAVAAITQRGRFGPVWLNPFNTRGLRPQSEQQQDSEPAG